MNLKEKRISRNLSQEELAKMVGISKNSMALIENNQHDPSLGLARKFSKVLNSTLDELFPE